MPTLKIPGRMIEVVDEGVQWTKSGKRTNGLDVQRVATMQVAGVRSAGDAVPVDVADDSILVLHLEGGFKLFSRYDQFRADFPGTAVRDVEPGVYTIQPNLGLVDTDRTIGTFALQALEIFKIKPDQTTALALARRFEDQLE